MTGIGSLNERIIKIPRQRITDSRGWFLKTLSGFEEGLPKEVGEIYTVFSENGASRGGHYHKEATEWFILLSGYSTLQLRDFKTDESMSIILDADNPFTVVVPPFVAHRFDGIYNKSFLLLAYTDIQYDPTDTIAYIFK